MNLHTVFLFFQSQGLLIHLFPFFLRGLVYVYKHKCNNDSIEDAFFEYLRIHNPQVYNLVLRSTDKLKLINDQRERLLSKGVFTVLWGESLYPKDFYALSDAPLIFSVRGQPCWISNSMLSVVGSRDPSLETRKWMEFHLGEFLKKSKYTLISGGARGVDQLAHFASLRESLPTLAILPSGLGRIYPHHFSEIAENIIQFGGAILSEYPHEMPMNKGHFHHRNRLIASMGVGTLILQANKKSGTMITANHAAQLNKPVWVIPGHPVDDRFGGSLGLIADGATIVRDALDLIMFCQAESLVFENEYTYTGEEQESFACI